MKPILPALICLSALCACAGQPPLEVRPEKAEVSLNSSAPTERIRAETTATTIRAFAPARTQDGTDATTEVAGAGCTLESDHLTGRVVIPQVVLLPKYDQHRDLPERGVPPSILVTCEADGRQGSALLAAKPGKIVSGSGNLAADLILITGNAIAAANAD